MTEGDEVTVSGVIAYDHPGNDWVEIKFAENPHGRAIVPRDLLPEALPPRGPDGMRNLTCGACGGEFGTNFAEEEIECAHCDARRCPHCGEWFGRDD